MPLTAAIFYNSFYKLKKKKKTYIFPVSSNLFWSFSILYSPVILLMYYMSLTLENDAEIIVVFNVVMLVVVVVAVVVLTNQ